MSVNPVLSSLGDLCYLQTASSVADKDKEPKTPSEWELLTLKDSFSSLSSSLLPVTEEDEQVQQNIRTLLVNNPTVLDLKSLDLGTYLDITFCGDVSFRNRLICDISKLRNHSLWPKNLYPESVKRSSEQAPHFEAAYASVVCDLFESVQERARQSMIDKLDPKTQWNFLVPEHDKAKMDTFLKGSVFDTFYEDLTQTMTLLTCRDLETIGEGNPSPNAKRFLQLADTLDQNGFPNVRGRRINFWSGIEAREKASQELGVLSDSKVGVMCALLEIYDKLRTEEGEDPYAVSHLLAQAVSTVYASQATGEVHFYFSNNKQKEAFGRGVMVGNIFWNTELRTLQARKNKGKIAAIQNISLDETTKQWLPAVSVSDDTVRLERRNSHSLDAEEDKEQFYDSIQSAWHNDFNAFRSTSPPRRSSITVGKMKDLIQPWKDNSKIPGKIKSQVTRQRSSSFDPKFHETAMRYAKKTPLAPSRRTSN